MFSTNECIDKTSDILRLWLHEKSRVYGDKLTEEKDIDAFLKVQVDLCKKNFEVILYKDLVLDYNVAIVGTLLPLYEWETVVIHDVDQRCRPVRCR